MGEQQDMEELFSSLEPPPNEVARGAEAIWSRLRQLDERPSLFQEWVGLLKVRPLSTPALALAGCAALLMLTPTSSLLLGALFG